MKLISRARRTPMAWGSSTVRPQPGMTPTRAWVSPKRARSEATRKSQASASSKPPVMATPLTAPMTGLVIAGNGPRTAGPVAPTPAPRLPPVLPELLQVEAGAEGRIGAGEDDRRRRRRARRPRAAPRAGAAAPRSTRALRASGRLSVTVATRSLTSTSTTSVIVAAWSPSSAGRKSNFRSPRRTSVDAIQPPSAPKCSSSSWLEPSASVSSSSS